MAETLQNMSATTPAGTQYDFTITQLAAEYSAANTYALGDYCVRQGQLYRCTTAIATAEAWNAAHWTAVKNLRESATDEQAVEAVGIYPVWAAGKSYEIGIRVQYGGALYRCLQSHDSQATWTPTDAPSLWAEVLIPDPETIPEWVQPDSTNPYMTGDKVTHNGKTWVSTIDNNVWEPGVYGWEEV